MILDTSQINYSLKHENLPETYRDRHESDGRSVDYQKN